MHAQFLYLKFQGLLMTWVNNYMVSSLGHAYVYIKAVCNKD